MSDAGNEAQLNVIAERLFDIWNYKAQSTTAKQIAELQVQVATLKAAEASAREIRVARDREIKDIKTTVASMDGKIDTLVTDKAGRDTAISLAKWIVGTGFLGVVGSVIIATLHYIGVLRADG